MNKLRDNAANVAEQILRIDFLACAGRTINSTDIIAIAHWRSAVKGICSRRWEHLFLSAENRVSGDVFSNDRIAFAAWNDVVQQVEVSLMPSCDTLEAHIKNRLGGTVKQRMITHKMICWITRMAVIEAHFETLCQCKAFGRLLKWLRVGHLPCGCSTDDLETGMLEVY